MGIVVYYGMTSTTGESMNADMYPDTSDLCICGEILEQDQEFCCSDCEQDFFEIQYAMHCMNSVAV